MLVDTQYSEHSKKLICSYVDKDGNIKLKHFDWAEPFQFEVCEETDKYKDPKYRSWDNKPIKKSPTNRPDRYSIYEFIDALPAEDQEEIYGFVEPKIFFVDIETEVLDEFPDPKIAPTMVQAISVVYDDKIILMGLKDLSKESANKIQNQTNEYFKRYNTDYKVKYVKYDDEFSMLYAFFHDMVPKMSVITGWNFINFDWQFLVNRARKLVKDIHGRQLHIDVSKSSPTNRMYKIFMTDYEVPLHRMIFDYMQLYEICNTSIKVKESSSLDFVADKLVGLPKIKYNGSLTKLYEDDFELFMYYNAVDSVLVKMIHEKTNYVSIIYGIASLSKIKVSDVISQLNNALASLAITEGVLRGRFREMDNVIVFKDRNRAAGGTTELAGGWVKDPVVGMNRWVVCYDFSSLYPTSQRQFFISPENFIGRLREGDEEKKFCYNNGVKIELNAEKHVVLVNGCVFLKRESPTICMLRDVFNDRKKHKKIMMAKKEEYQDCLDEIKKLKAELEMEG